MHLRILGKLHPDVRLLQHLRGASQIRIALDELRLLNSARCDKKEEVGCPLGLVIEWDCILAGEFRLSISYFAIDVFLHTESR